MLGWLSLVLCALVHAQNASTNASTAPTSAPTSSENFPIPSLPISKANALYPECRAEIIFVLDVSSSVTLRDQKKMMRFVVQFMIAVESNILDARFGVVIFGIERRGTDPTVSRKSFNATEFGGGITRIPGPYGNAATEASTETALSLSHLTYNCTECRQVNSSWSQLEYMYTIGYGGWLTPTWDGIDFGRDEYERLGDPAVPGRFIVLVTDGVPNDGTCMSITEPGCKDTILRATEAVNAAKNGTLLLTVGVKLDNLITQNLMVEWASQPADILAVPNTDYDKLNDLIGKILSVLCPAGKGIDCLAEDATAVDIAGTGFLNTAELGCRFFRDGESPTPDHDTKAIWRNSTLISCPIPTANWFPGEWNLHYTQDGRGYYKGARFKTGTLCRPELLVIWWPFIALGLLPLAFCRSKKTAPATTQKVTRGVARPAPAATEEYEEYEEVEEIVAPPEPVNKWKVAPTAYIGFGRARMSVDWAGVAPESAPHEGVRKKVVKKVVSDHAPVPTAGPAAVPTPAPEAPTETVTQSRPQVVEEPDWVNSCLDRVAAIVCCCCVKRK